MQAFNIQVSSTLASQVQPAQLLCDRHPADQIAFTVIDANLDSVDLSYGLIKDRSERAASLFAARGIKPGDRVATLMSKSAELVYTLLGLWRLGAVHVPLFTAFATPAIEVRVAGGGAKLIIADDAQLPKLELLDYPVLSTGELGPLLDQQPAGFTACVRLLDDPLVEIFTSGTTGTPKGVPVPVRALEAFNVYFQYGLDVQEDDVFWNVADPGWAYGLYYGILAPLYAGRRNLLLTTGFSAELCWQVLAKFGVTNFASAPTIVRSMRASHPNGVPGLNIKRASSAGEPLDAPTIAWSESVLGVPVRDHYGQTEMGMCIVNGWAPEVIDTIKPGSMGRPMPGYSACVLFEDKDECAPAGTRGRVAINIPGSPMMWFNGYSGDPMLTAARYSADGRWYYTGDAGTMDEDGYIFFSSRDDDVIIMAGYRIGPFEVESVLAAHPDVLESAVIGVPDELRGEVLVAYVVLRSGLLGSYELTVELQQLVKTQYAAHAYPRRITYVSELPKTPSGKLQRFVLRDAESLPK
ncbi:AMP-dependent synthetase [Arthrobacter sp. MYb227]|uniref:AMP-binding protein n=1 Tax=Arthrobacter sp. MYb227 TaxID=1848601 RepID=UPI000CFD8781|nr:AMP-binding protein [Arthrobacter sp. MYb227]PQZ91694.1 AMP-dependent synthetase [Arthrobacter sp. MYb227]